MSSVYKNPSCDDLFGTASFGGGGGNCRPKTPTEKAIIVGSATLIGSYGGKPGATAGAAIGTYFAEKEVCGNPKTYGEQVGGYIANDGDPNAFKG